MPVLAGFPPLLFLSTCLSILAFFSSPSLVFLYFFARLWPSHSKISRLLLLPPLQSRFSFILAFGISQRKSRSQSRPRNTARVPGKPHKSRTDGQKAKHIYYKTVGALQLMDQGTPCKSKNNYIYFFLLQFFINQSTNTLTLLMSSLFCTVSRFYPSPLLQGISCKPALYMRLCFLHFFYMLRVKSINSSGFRGDDKRPNASDLRQRRKRPSVCLPPALTSLSSYLILATSLCLSCLPTVSISAN